MSKMTDNQAAKAFAALGNSTRLLVVRTLVRAGPDGLTVGEIQNATRVAASTLAHHLASLVSVGIVRQEKLGREMISRVNFESIEELSEHLLTDCCAGVNAATSQSAA